MVEEEFEEIFIFFDCIGKGKIEIVQIKDVFCLIGLNL